MFRRAIERRLLPHAAVWFLLWPVASAVAGTLDLKTQSATALLPWFVTFGMLMRAQPQLASEWVFVALAGCAVSVAIFAAASFRGDSNFSRRRLAVEPLLLMLAATAGVATEFPAVLAHPFLRSLRPVSVRASIGLLTAAAVLLFGLFGYRAGGRRGAFRWLVACVLILSASALGARLPAARPIPGRTRNSIVLLGVDSLSQADDLTPLRRMAAARGGAWHSRAVTPGLVTNAVWTAILQERPVRETGVWTICMSADWARAPFDLVRAAHRSGFRTRSYFSDQFTSYIGSEAGFDENRSGPLGWLQLATATIKQNSIFLPLVLPRLPRLPGARTPRNQSGTFAWDIGSELDEIFSTPSGDAGTFSAGHLDYLHQPLYPRFDELSPVERRVVLRSPVSAVEDLSFDWQYPEIPGDRLGLYRWKVRHVQEAVAAAADRTGFLASGSGNRLVVFSDHGSRRDLTERNFSDAKYWNVVLATFGIPGQDRDRPTSLLEIPAMLGLSDAARAALPPPVVSFSPVEAADIPKLTPYFLPDGRVLLDPRVLERIGNDIREFSPYGK